MSAPSSAIRTYRWLGCLALAHALLLFGLLSVLLKLGSDFQDPPWFRSLWVGLVTLWFLWLPVLILHRGRSLLRCSLFLSLAVVFLFPSCRFYNIFGPERLGLPEYLTSMDPITVASYFHAYWVGRTEAKKDLTAGVLAIEEFGMGAGSGSDVVLEKSGVEIRPTASCVVNDWILGHAAGYNSVSKPEIDRRVGLDRVEAAKEEGHRRLAAEYEKEKQFFEELTRRLSGIPAGSKVKTTAVSAYIDGRPLKDPDAETELRQFVQSVEGCVVEATAGERCAFDLHVRAKITPGLQPNFEASARSDAPKATYDAVFHKLVAMSPAQWSRSEAYIYFDFSIREDD
jgi:hypothetical protein